MEKDILQTLKNKERKLPRAQRQLAKYISENYDKASYMTAARLAKTVGVSEATVIRFAYELGYPGYPEMRKALQELVRGRLTSVQRIAASRERLSGENLVSMVMESDMEKLRSTAAELDGERFDRAVETLNAARRVYILGMRSSAALASFTGFYLNYLLDNVTVVSEGTGGEVYEQLLHIGPPDVLLCISFPRYTSDSLRAARFAKQRGARLVTLTDNDASPFVRESDISLFASSDMVSFVDSLVAPLSLINALILAIGVRRRESLEDTFGKLEKLWDEYEVFAAGES